VANISEYRGPQGERAHELEDSEANRAHLGNGLKTFQYEVIGRFRDRGYLGNYDPNNKGNNTWQVTEACGGINYLIASLVVGYLYAGTVYRRWRHRLAFLVSSALVPLAANALRVYTTILLDYLGASRVVSGMLHYLFGVLVFGIVMIVLFAICGRWREDPSTGEDPTFLPPPVVPVVSMRRAVLCVTLAALLVVIGPVAAVFWLPRG